jgi:predicted metalloprotease with PDZ domain
MWPYDYSRENETPLLWVSEGFTNYYAGLALYRSGIIDRNRFLQDAASAITQIEGLEPRKYISPAESSASTWLGYDTGTEFEISYYTQGQNLGALLDLSILHDTNGAADLDDVMRALYKDFYQKGKGFSTEDMIGIINRLTKKDYHDFYNRYVWGVEVPDYDRLFGYAGYQTKTTSRKVPEIGIKMSFSPEGIKVTGLKDGGSAAKAGIQVGDIINTIDGTRQWRGRLNEKIGQTVKVSLKRGAEEKTMDLAVASRDDVSYQIVEVPNATSERLKIREAWLKH